MVIRPVEPGDSKDWLRMRTTLFGDDRSLAHEIRQYFGDPGDGVTLVAVRDRGGLCGFIEVSLRDYAEGCASSPVPYIEGWFVDSDSRGHGVGRALVRGAEEWAKKEGFTEMASDAEASNRGSIAAHKKLGYERVEDIVCFRRKLR